MMNTKRLMIVCSILVLALASPAHASWLLGVSAGGQAGVSHTYGDIDDSSFIIGGNVRVEVLSMLAGEFAIDYRNESLDAGDIRTIPMQVSVLFTLLPFIYTTAGGGWYDINVDGDLRDQFGTENLSNHGWHLGAGIGIPVPGPWTVIADGRFVFLNYDKKAPGMSDRADYYQITGGLQYKIF